MVELAKAAYIAYGDAVAWKNHRGDPMPAWDDLPEAIRAAWVAAANAIVGEIDARIGDLFDHWIMGRVGR